MALDNNKNQPGDYALFTRALDSQVFYKFNPNGPSGNPTRVLLPGNGLLSGPMHSDVLASNSCDIESMLRGIRANDLVNGPFSCCPDLVSHSSLDLFPKTQPVMPPKLIVRRDQRPPILN
jgi:hypothetical protein